MGSPLPEFSAALRDLGFYCRLSTELSCINLLTRDAYSLHCAEPSAVGGQAVYPSGISFHLAGGERRTFVTVPSGATYVFGPLDSIRQFVVDLLKGNVVPPGRAPYSLPAAAVQGTGGQPADLFVAVASEEERLGPAYTAARSRSSTLAYDLILSRLEAAGVRIDPVDRDTLSLSIGGATVLTVRREPKTAVEIQPFALLGGVRMSDEHSMLIHTLSRAVPGRFFDVGWGNKVLENDPFYQHRRGNEPVEEPANAWDGYEGEQLELASIH